MANGCFRFPRRTIAVALLETEGRVLPVLAPRLPYPIPVPVWFGRPHATYKWPFLGYRRLDGHVVSDVDLDDAARAALAAPLARFLRALHDVPLAEAQAWGVPPDALDISTRRGWSGSPGRR
jgi:aminoglycoside phosphotransferase (APT) family kinase protein